jgi:PAB1-binding protein PBP1
MRHSFCPNSQHSARGTGTERRRNTGAAIGDRLYERPVSEKVLFILRLSDGFWRFVWWGAAA